MSTTGEGGDLQFERAEYAGGSGGPACSNCKQPAVPQYHQFNGKVYCGTCRSLIEQSIGKLEQSGSMGRAFLFGLGAAAAGSVIYYAVSKLTGYQLGLIAVLVGFLVGKAIRFGSGNIGGRRYQFLAVLLTYLSICSSAVPAITKGLYQAEDRFDQDEAKAKAESRPPQRRFVRSGTPAFYISALVLALLAPVLGGFGILGTVIIAFGLWEAWKFNRRLELKFTGPFAVAAAP
jgi:hypothetical protein